MLLKSRHGFAEIQPAIRFGENFGGFYYRFSAGEFVIGLLNGERDGDL